MISLIAALTVRIEALTAEYGTISAGLERNLSGTAAAIADHVIHLTLATVVVLAIGLTTGCTASRATAGLVLEALVSIELLLGSGEYELVAALTAYQSLVFEHGYNPPNHMSPFDD